MAISRQWRGKAICIAGFGGLSLHRRFPLQIDCIFWAWVWDQIESRPLPIFLPSPPTLFWRSLSLLSWPRILYKHDLSSCYPRRNKSRNDPLIHDKPPPPALLRAEDGADSQWRGWGEKSGQFKLKDLRVAGSSPVWRYGTPSVCIMGTVAPQGQQALVIGASCRSHLPLTST